MCNKVDKLKRFAQVLVNKVEEAEFMYFEYNTDGSVVKEFLT